MEKWRDLAPWLAQPVHFVHEPAEEDRITAAYLRDTAEQAGLKTSSLLMKDIGWRTSDSTFVDLQNQSMRSIFKLYPWEWLFQDEFAPHLLTTQEHVTWIEPIWKMLWSNKALLPILWELFPDHELLLPAYFDDPKRLNSYVKKPIFGREGANIHIVQHGITMEATSGNYPDGPFIYQEYTELATAGGIRAVIGSWLIDGEPGGIGIRETAGLITGNTSCFVPHLFHP